MFVFVLLSCFIDRYVRRDELLEARSTQSRETGVMWRSTSYSWVKNRCLSQEYNRAGGSDLGEKKAGGASRMYLSPTSVPSLPL